MQSQLPILVLIGPAALLLGSCQQPPKQEELEAALLEVERERLAALVKGDWETLDKLHADNFKLVNPRGESMSKADYLHPIRDGDFRYLVFEPVGKIETSVSGDAGAVRYRSRLSVEGPFGTIPPVEHMHTDYYELRNGQWQVVYSQATAVEDGAE